MSNEPRLLNNNETEDDDDDKNATKTESKSIFKSLKSFTKRTKTLSDEEATDIELAQQTIEYGNLTKNYDPTQSVTKTTKDELLTKAIVLEEDEDYSNKVYWSLFNENKTNPKTYSPNKNSMIQNDTNLIRKASLLKLIERNRLNQICCPFDEIVYTNLSYEPSQLPIELIEPKRIKMRLDHLDSLKKFEYRQFDLKNDSLDYLLPNCISTFLMQYFFDIFPPSELKLLTPSILEILLKLKSLFKPQVHLDSNLKLTHLLEDILWNCFALFKYKYDKSFTKGFINYYQSLFTIINHCKNDFYFQKLKLETGIRKLAPYYIEALILTGLFDESDFKTYSKLIAFEHDELMYEAYKIIENKMKSLNQPMKLKHMCRIRIKNEIKEFNSIHLDALNISENLKSFILFNSEFESYYNENKSLLINLNS